MRHMIREADIRRKTRTKATTDFLRREMPYRELPSSTEPEPELPKQLIIHKGEAKKQRSSPLHSTEIETSKRGYDDDVTEGLRRKKKKTLVPRHFLDTQCAIREDGEQLMISDSPCL